MPKKIRELKQIVSQAGFILQKGRGKGSHTYWVHPKMPLMPLTIPGKDSDDAPRYLEPQIVRALQALTELEDESE